MFTKKLLCLCLGIKYRSNKQRDSAQTLKYNRSIFVQSNDLIFLYKDQYCRRSRKTKNKKTKQSKTVTNTSILYGSINLTYITATLFSLFYQKNISQEQSQSPIVHGVYYNKSPYLNIDIKQYLGNLDLKT